MLSAPAVVYPVERCALNAWVMLALGGLGAACVFMAWPELPCAWSSTALVAWSVWSVAALRGHFTAVPGLLQWSAEAPGSASGRDSGWIWKPNLHAEGLPIHEMDAVLDLQRWILLRLRGNGAMPSWVWAECARAPHDWLALRRAVAADRTG